MAATCGRAASAVAEDGEELHEALQLSAALAASEATAGGPDPGSEEEQEVLRTALGLDAVQQDIDFHYQMECAIRVSRAQAAQEAAARAFGEVARREALAARPNIERKRRASPEVGDRVQ